VQFLQQVRREQLQQQVLQAQRHQQEELQLQQQVLQAQLALVPEAQ
jgi:hypothetical protein